MSAAAPPPPPHITPVNAANGYSHSGPSRGESRGQTRHYAHIKDLVKQAESQINPNLSVTRLLENANNALSAAGTHLDFKRPDYAFPEYLVAQIIISKVIPGHRDSLQLRDHPRLKGLYNDCVKKIAEKRAIFDAVEKEVREDNRISGVRQRGESELNNLDDEIAAFDRPNGYSQQRTSIRPQSVQLPSNGNGYVPNSIATNRMSLIPERTRELGHDTRPRPPIHAKPSSLQGHALSQSSRQTSAASGKDGSDPLISRFSKLRVTSPTLNGHIGASNDTMQPFVHQQMRNEGNKSAVLTQTDLLKDLPKLPSPTYSPASAVPEDPEFRLLRGSQSQSLVDSDTASLASTTLQSNQQTPSVNTNGTPATRQGTGTSQTILKSARSRSENMPQETEINAQRLFDYLRTFNVLLIDVRSREEFDAGHIWCQSIVCIEPTALRPHKSAEELQETLVIGTDNEYALFAQRHEFDLVVYFDQQTSSTSFLSGVHDETSPLRCLYESLHTYNQDKPLRWQPVLLTGGMDAWIDLTGAHSLQTSNTVASRSSGIKPARPIARRPLASGSSRLNITKRRLRDYNPLGAEEEMKWRERARSEVVLEFPSHEPQAEPTEDTVVEEFQLRYPDVPALEYQALVARPPSRPPPEAPKPPQYAEPPAVPSRPPPAVPRPSYRGVSERVAPQNQQVLKASHLPHHIPSEMRRLPRTGLYNFGVTCYMNATIQCLSATLPLSAFFLTDRYHSYIQKENWKGSKGLLSELYHKLLTHLWRPSEYDTVRPKHFRQFCARLNREWGFDRQQDAKEFLEFIIDTLHEDFNVAWARNPLRALTAAEEAARENTPPFLASKREFARYQHRDASKLTDLFAGQHISRLQCTSCLNSSTTYETFYSISVEIPPSSRGRPVSIHDCLRSYCSSEMLSGEEVWRCPHCKKEREATKRITISRAPEFLVVHFKRFSASHSEKARKVHTPVEFPLTKLDLGPYMLPPPNRETVDYLEKRFGPESFEVETPIGMQPPYHYDAYAVMRHLGGTMTSGHYIALCKDQSTGAWREYNDDKVTDFRPEKLSSSKRLQNEQAYIVFYQRTT